jgi:hypothetical protein
MPRIPAPLRIAGFYLANLFAAVVGTSMLDPGIARAIAGPASLTTLRRYCLAEDLISAAMAFVLGYFSYWKLKSATAKWVWIAGALWFGQYVFQHRAEIDNMYFVESSYPDVTASTKMLETWLSYTLPFLRTIFYSVGAFCCVKWGDQWISSLFQSLAAAWSRYRASALCGTTEPHS